MRLKSLFALSLIRTAHTLRPSRLPRNMAALLPTQKASSDANTTPLPYELLESRVVAGKYYKQFKNDIL